MEAAVAVPEVQYFYKTLPPTSTTAKAAVLIINAGTQNATLTVDFADVPGACSTCNVRDIWNHNDLGTSAAWTGDVASHDCVFLVIEG